MLPVIDRANNWASMFCVFLLLALVVQKSINSALYLCEHRIKNLGRDARDERKEYQNLAQLMETRLFGKCREMFHSTFNTQGGGMGSFNPIRDGLSPWRGTQPDMKTKILVSDLQRIVTKFGMYCFLVPSAHPPMVNSLLT
jgi:hypothetical protein